MVIAQLGCMRSRCSVFMLSVGNSFWQMGQETEIGATICTPVNSDSGTRFNMQGD